MFRCLSYLVDDRGECEFATESFYMSLDASRHPAG